MSTLKGYTIPQRKNYTKFEEAEEAEEPFQGPKVRKPARKLCLWCTSDKHEKSYSRKCQKAHDRCLGHMHQVGNQCIDPFPWLLHSCQGHKFMEAEKFQGRLDAVRNQAANAIRGGQDPFTFRSDMNAYQIAALPPAKRQRVKPPPQEEFQRMAQECARLREQNAHLMAKATAPVEAIDVAAPVAVDMELDDGDLKIFE